MSKKRWLIFFRAGIAPVCAALMLLSAGFFAGCSAGSQPVYKSDQTDSSHPGYRRSTLTCGNEIYVNDYEETCLQLADPAPTQSIGYMGWVGNAHVCAIRGQPTTAYIAGDVGSEMPAYEPFRNIKQPPFDWRTATFREMSAYLPNESSSYRVTTNTALIVEVLRTLREGAPVELPDITFVNAHTNLYTLKLASDQLPGLLFCPPVCVDAHGQFYLAESLMLDYTPPNPPQLHARWIPASPMLTEWLKAP